MYFNAPLREKKSYIMLYAYVHLSNDLKLRHTLRLN